MFRNVLIAMSIPALALFSGCRATQRHHVPASSNVPLFSGLGNHTRQVTNNSALAQKYFNQGLVLTLAFNHDEAIRAFTEASRLDPDCAMAWWGIAYANGPHINRPEMTPAQSTAAWDALQKAIARKDQGTLTEQALIEALAQRYASPAPANRRSLDEAYADAMRAVWHAHCADADVGTLYAESLMNLRPWDLWTKEGTPQPGTEEIVATLEVVMRLDPNHPGANHLYIHAVEASPEPERAMASADRLRRSVPFSGHLVHMPSHIDVKTGQWDNAVQQNDLAIAADREYRTLVPKQDFYRMYMGHNHHMLAFAAMMSGRSAEALQASRDLKAAIPSDYLAANPLIVDPFYDSDTDVLMRFGLWDDVLAQPKPPIELAFTTAKWHFARGVAYAAKGQVEEAQREQTAFRAAAAAIPSDRVLSINLAKDVLGIAEHMLEGEIAFRRGNIAEAEAALRQAIVIEDNLRYMEPPEWIQPVRHTLGAILLHAGRYEDAEEVYLADLENWPDNGWSLYGLSESLRAKNEPNEAREVEKDFRRTWAKADVQIASSCLCVAKKQ